MRKLLFLLALGAASPVWAQDAAPQAPVAPIAPQAPVLAAPDAAPFAWQLRLTAGQKWLTTTDTTTLTTQQFPPMGGPAMSMKTRMSSRLVTEQNVVSSDEKGARIELIYREMSQSSLMSQGEQVIFDTANPPAGMKLPDVSKALVGVKLSFLVSPGGQVSELKGMEEYATRLNTEMEGAAPAMMAAMKAQTQSTMSPDAMQKALSSVYKTLPLQAVAPGQSWKYLDESPMMGTTFSTQGEGTFVSREAGIVALKQSATFATDGGAEFKVPMPKPDPNAPAPRSQLDLHGSTSGQSWIDEKSGLEVRNHSVLHMEGEIVISGMGGRGTSMTLPMTIESEVSTQTTPILPAAQGAT